MTFTACVESLNPGGDVWHYNIQILSKTLVSITAGSSF